jgi:hypothetical protein
MTRKIKTSCPQCNGSGYVKTKHGDVKCPNPECEHGCVGKEIRRENAISI